MNITQEQIDELNAVLRVKLAPEDYEPQVEKTLKEHSKKVNMPGFRPGKVPFGMVKKMYGKSVMVDEINKILSDSLYKYLNENKLEILGNPLPRREADIDWDNQKEFEFSYDLGLAPQFDLKLDNNLKFDVHTIKVDEDLISKQMDDIRKRYGKMTSPETTEAGDIIYGEFAQLDESGNIKEDGITKTSTLVIDRIKDEETKNKLTGLKAEDSVEVNSKKLSDNPTDLAAMLGIEKSIAEILNTNFRFTVKNISRMEPAELNQELFDKVYGEGNVNSEEEFRNKVIADIQNMFKGDIDNRLYNDISTYLIENTNISLPDDFLKRWMQSASEKPVTMEQIEADYGNYSKALKWQLIENKLIKENGINVSEEEVMGLTKDLIRSQFAQYGQTNISDEELTSTAKRILGNKDEAKRIYDRLYDKKILELFKNTLTLEEKELSIDDFYGAAKGN